MLVHKCPLHALWGIPAGYGVGWRQLGEVDAVNCCYCISTKDTFKSALCLSLPIKWGSHPRCTIAMDSWTNGGRTPCGEHTRMATAGIVPFSPLRVLMKGNRSSWWLNSNSCYRLLVTLVNSPGSQKSSVSEGINGKIFINSINARLCTSRLVCQRLTPYRGRWNDALSIKQRRGLQSSYHHLAPGDAGGSSRRSGQKVVTESWPWSQPHGLYRVKMVTW